jgi:hypothetical protein
VFKAEIFFYDLGAMTEPGLELASRFDNVHTAHDKSLSRRSQRSLGEPELAMADFWVGFAFLAAFLATLAVRAFDRKGREGFAKYAKETDAGSR